MNNLMFDYDITHMVDRYLEVHSPTDFECTNSISKEAWVRLSTRNDSASGAWSDLMASIMLTLLYQHNIPMEIASLRLHQLTRFDMCSISSVVDDLDTTADKSRRMRLLRHLVDYRITGLNVINIRYVGYNLFEVSYD